MLYIEKAKKSAFGKSSENIIPLLSSATDLKMLLNYSSIELNASEEKICYKTNFTHSNALIWILIALHSCSEIVALVLWFSVGFC